MKPQLTNWLDFRHQRLQHAWDVQLGAWLRASIMVFSIRIAFIVFATAVGVKIMMVFGQNIGQPLPEIASSLLNIAIVAAITLILLIAVEAIGKKGRLNAEYVRKIAHVGAGLIYFFAPYLFATHWPVLCLALIFTTVFIISRRFGFFPSLHPASRQSIGELVYPFGIYLAFLLAEGNSLLFQISVLVLAFADTAASLIGQRYGRLHYKIMKSIRSVEGSLAFGLITFLIVLISLYVFTDVAGYSSIAVALGTGFIVTIVEAISPKGLDNVFVPVSTLLTLSAFSVVV